VFCQGKKVNLASTTVCGRLFHVSTTQLLAKCVHPQIIKQWLTPCSICCLVFYAAKNMAELLLDSDIRIWVFLPIVVITFLVGIIRHYVTILLSSEKKVELQQIADRYGNLCSKEYKKIAEL